MEIETEGDYDPIDWKKCDHQYEDQWERDLGLPNEKFNFCPWCGKDLSVGDSDLRKEKENGT